MTPDKIAKESEHSQQAAFFAFCVRSQHKGYREALFWADLGVPGVHLFDSIYNEPNPYLKWIHAIPNGGSRGSDAKSRAIQGGKMKAEGVKSGVLDVFLPLPRKCKVTGAILNHGLYIEFKKPSLQPKRATTENAGLSSSQIEFKDYVKSVFYRVNVCYTWQQAVKALIEYIS